MTEKLQQSSIRVLKKRRRGGKRAKVMAGGVTFLHPKAKGNDKTSPLPVPSTMGDDAYDKKTSKLPDLTPTKSHQENRSDINKLLCGFDLNYDFGPCIGLSRLERWERAYALGLHPSEEIKTLLVNSSCEQESLFARMRL